MNGTFSYAGYILEFWEHFLFSNGLKNINIAQENPWYIFTSSAGDEWLLDVNSLLTAANRQNQVKGKGCGQILSYKINVFSFNDDSLNFGHFDLCSKKWV